MYEMKPPQPQIYWAFFLSVCLTQKKGDVASKVQAFTVEIPPKLYRHDEK